MTVSHCVVQRLKNFDNDDADCNPLGEARNRERRLEGQTKVLCALEGPMTLPFVAGEPAELVFIVLSS